MEKRDLAQGAPPPGSILFVGSSSVAKWDLKSSFPDLPVYNRGFGGSQIRDSTFYADRLALRFAPRVVVFYAGDNDIGARRTREQVVGDFQSFALKVRAALPDTKLVFLPIKPSVRRWKSQPEIVATNAAIAAWMSGQTDMIYVDTATPMLSAQGELRPELYTDGLHMTPAGYEIWTRALAPYLAQLMAKTDATTPQ